MTRGVRAEHQPKHSEHEESNFPHHSRTPGASLSPSHPCLVRFFHVMSKTEIELRMAAASLMGVQADSDQKSGKMPTVEVMKASIRLLDAIIASQAAEKSEQDQGGFSA